MIFFNPNIKLKVTYRKIIRFEEPLGGSKLFSLSQYDHTSKTIKERFVNPLNISFNSTGVTTEILSRLYEYSTNNFLKALRHYDSKGRLSFITRFEINEITKESVYYKAHPIGYAVQSTKPDTHGPLYKRDDLWHLDFQRVGTVYGYNVKVKYKENEERDFKSTELYDRNKNELIDYFEHYYEYHSPILQSVVHDFINHEFQDLSKGQIDYIESFKTKI